MDAKFESACECMMILVKIQRKWISFCFDTQLIYTNGAIEMSVEVFI